MKKDAVSILGVVSVCGGLAWFHPAYALIAGGLVLFVVGELRAVAKKGQK